MAVFEFMCVYEIGDWGYELTNIKFSILYFFVILQKRKTVIYEKSIFKKR